MLAAARVVCLTVILSALPFLAAAEDFTNAIRALLQQRVEVERKDVAIVVGIVDESGSRVINCGKMDNGTGRDVDGDTLFELGSITKTFTGLLLQDMVERGEMNPHDPVARFLPAAVRLPTRRGKEITLLHLATHCSGLPFFPDNLNPERADNPLADYTVEKLEGFLSGYQLTRNPGSKYEYSEVGMQLLGYALALKAGTNYEALLVDRICRPLRMDSTRITLTPELQSRLAAGHDPLGGRTPSLDFKGLVGGSALRSTANDLLRYVAAHLDLASSSLTPLMEKTQAAQVHLAPAYQMGLAWLISRDLRGTRIVRHGGATPGHSGFIGFDRSRRRGVVVLASSEDIIDIAALGKLLLKSEWRTDQRPTATKLSSRDYGGYVGHYRLSADLALGILTLRQVLLHAPKVLIWGPAGVSAAVILLLFWRVRRLRKRWARGALFWRAAGSRCRWTILGGAVLGGGLAAVLALLLAARAVCALCHPGLGIRREGDRLFMQTTLSPATLKRFPQVLATVFPFINNELVPHLTLELLAQSQTRFFERLSGIPITFARDHRGVATGLSAHIPGAECSFEKVSETAPEPMKPRVAVRLDPKLLDAYVGSYEFPPDFFFPDGITLTLRRQGDRLVGRASGKKGGWGAFDIYPESETNFFLTIVGVQLSFVKDSRGAVTAATRHAVGLTDSVGRKLKTSSD